MTPRSARWRWAEGIVVVATAGALLTAQAVTRGGAQAAPEVLTLEVDSVSFGGLLAPSLTNYAAFSVSLTAESHGTVLFQATGGRGGTFGVRYTPRGAP